MSMEQLKVVTLEELKAQTRVDFDDEDDMLALYGAASEDVIIGGTGRTIKELNAMGYAERTGEELEDEEAQEVGNEYFPLRLKQAILLFAAHMYKHHELTTAVAQNMVPYSIGVLTKPYRKLSDRKV